MEIFKSIIGFEGLYEVSNLGRVKSLIKYKGTNERILKPAIGSHGYYNLALVKDSKKYRINIHQLVAIVFLNHKPKERNGMVVNHKNHDKLDNRVSNLEIISSRKNTHLKDIKYISKFSSKYIGVSLIKKTKKWAAFININGKNKNLGTFTKEIDAHNAYQKALNNL